MVDNDFVSFSQKNYQHGKNTAKNENTMKRNEKHGGNKNRMIATMGNNETHLNA